MANDTLDKIKLGFTKLGVKASSTREKQKIKSKALLTEKEVTKLLQSLGETVYEMWMEGSTDFTPLENKIEEIKAKKIEVEELVVEIGNIDERDRRIIEEQEHKMMEEQARRKQEALEKKIQKEEEKRQRAEEKVKAAERKEESERVNQPPPEVLVTPVPPERKALPLDKEAQESVLQNISPNPNADDSMLNVSSDSALQNETKENTEETNWGDALKRENPQDEEQSHLVCPNCGMSYDRVVKFCGECGTKMQQ